MATYVKIKVDTNDADYTEKLSEIRENHLNIIKKISSILKDKSFSSHPDYRYNWPRHLYNRGKTIQQLYIDTGLITEEELEFFNDYLPYGDFHSIESIDIFEVSKVEKLY